MKKIAFVILTIPFVLFSPAIVKVLSILVYIIGLVGGLINE